MSAKPTSASTTTSSPSSILTEKDELLVALPTGQAEEFVEKDEEGVDTSNSPTNTAKELIRYLFMLAMFFGGFLLISYAALGHLPFARSECSAPCVPGSEDIMRQKEHGTSHTPVQDNLRWNVDWDIADRICNFNRRYAEYSGYWETTSFLSDIEGKDQEVFYDSNTGKRLFVAPRDRSWDDWINESKKHGWPSFRDNEVDWDNVRVLPNGETVSLDGTHLVSINSKFESFGLIPIAYTLFRCSRSPSKYTNKRPLFFFLSSSKRYLGS